MSTLLKIHKGDLCLATEKWVSNGHWVLAREFFDREIFKLSSFYQGLLMSGIAFRKNKMGELLIGDKYVDRPDIEGMIAKEECTIAAEVTNITIGEFSAVKLVGRSEVAWASKIYSNILAERQWYANDETTVFQLIRRGDDSLPDETLGMLMGLGKEIRRQLAQQLSDLVGKGV